MLSIAGELQSVLEVFSVTSEAAYCQQIAESLKDLSWTKLLLQRLIEAGGVSNPNSRPHLFELRFAAELARSGAAIDYEYRAGVDNTTVEFRVVTPSSEWLIELVSLGVSRPVRDATKLKGDLWFRELSSDAEDCRQTEEREMVLAQEKIVQKVFDWRRQRPVKFPEVAPDRFHVIVADVRGYLGDGDGDCIDYAQMAYGEAGIPSDYRAFTHCWPPRQGSPIPGLFQGENSLVTGARTLQDRIHYLVFVNEMTFGPGHFGSQLFWASNPYLIPDSTVAKETFKYFPIQLPQDP
jgi:hypothetical protein